MSNYQSLRKAGFSAKALKARGITKEFPENPKFDESGDLMELSDIRHNFQDPKYGILYFTILHRILKHCSCPLDTPIGLVSVPMGGRTQTGEPCRNNYTTPAEMEELLKEHPDATGGGFYEPGVHYISIVDDPSYTGTQKIFMFCHEATHLVQNLTGLMDQHEHKDQSQFADVFSGEYEAQFLEMHANVNGLKFTRAYCKMLGFTYDKEWWKQSMQFYLDPIKYKDAFQRQETTA